MKRYFESAIEAKPFFRTYIVYYIPVFILAAISTAIDDEQPVVSAVLQLIYTVISSLIWFQFFAYAVKSVALDGKKFEFHGMLGEFLGKLIKWTLLTVITLGFYTPWYLKGFYGYYIDNTDYDGVRFSFEGKSGRLFKYFLLTLILPVFIFMAVFIAMIINSMNYENPGIYFSFIILVFIFIPFYYFLLNWLINITNGDSRISFGRSLSDYTFFIIPQILLTIITVGIYYPAAFVKIYRYIASGTGWNEDGKPDYGFGFSGTAGEGFCLLWGQGLLSIITLGIYTPWAVAKCSNWFLNNTFLEAAESV